MHPLRASSRPRRPVGPRPSHDPAARVPSRPPIFEPPEHCSVIHGEREALTRGPHPGRRDRAEPLARPDPRREGGRPCAGCGPQARPSWCAWRSGAAGAGTGCLARGRAGRGAVRDHGPARGHPRSPWARSSSTSGRSPRGPMSRSPTTTRASSAGACTSSLAGSPSRQPTTRCSGRVRLSEAARRSSRPLPRGSHWPPVTCCCYPPSRATNSTRRPRSASPTRARPTRRSSPSTCTGGSPSPAGRRGSGVRRASPSGGGMN